MRLLSIAVIAFTTSAYGAAYSVLTIGSTSFFDTDAILANQGKRF